jgi:hypothetical protein
MLSGLGGGEADLLEEGFGVIMRYYSYRKQTIGSNCAARLAGQ